jgi:hypothetical protein
MCLRNSQVGRRIAKEQDCAGFGLPPTEAPKQHEQELSCPEPGEQEFDIDPAIEKKAKKNLAKIGTDIIKKHKNELAGKSNKELDKLIKQLLYAKLAGSVPPTKKKKKKTVTPPSSESESSQSESD